MEVGINKKIKSIGYVLLSAGLAVFLYIFLYELGHTLVLLSVGATITDFSIFTAHVSAVGVLLMIRKRVIHNFIDEIRRK